NRGTGGEEEGDGDTLERHGFSFRVIQEGGAAAWIAAGSSPVRQPGSPGGRVKGVRERSRNGQSPVDREGRLLFGQGGQDAAPLRRLRARPRGGPAHRPGRGGGAPAPAGLQDAGGAGGGGAPHPHPGGAAGPRLGGRAP